MLDGLEAGDVEGAVVVAVVELVVAVFVVIVSLVLVVEELAC